MIIDQIAPEAIKLPTREGALLAASLWESIEDPFELSVSLDDEAALNLAEERDREIESGKVTAVFQEELMQRLPLCIPPLTPGSRPLASTLAKKTDCTSLCEWRFRKRAIWAVWNSGVERQYILRNLQPNIILHDSS